MHGVNNHFVSVNRDIDRALEHFQQPSRDLKDLLADSQKAVELIKATQVSADDIDEIEADLDPLVEIRSPNDVLDELTKLFEQIDHEHLPDVSESATSDPEPDSDERVVTDSGSIVRASATPVTVRAPDASITTSFQLSRREKIEYQASIIGYAARKSCSTVESRLIAALIASAVWHGLVLKSPPATVTEALTTIELFRVILIVIHWLLSDGV